MAESPHTHLAAAVDAAIASQTAIRRAAEDAALEDSDKAQAEALALPTVPPADSNG